MKHLDELSNNHKVHPLFILCADQDSENARTSNELRRALALQKSNIPLFAWIPEQPRIAELIRSAKGEKNKQKPKIIPFGECHQCCQYKHITNRLRDEIARIIYYAYQVDDESNKNDPTPLNSENNYDLYMSNLSAATMVPLKLAVLKLQVMEKERDNNEGLTILSESEFEKIIITSQSLKIIQEMEHNRWMAERLLRDWKYEALPTGYDPYPKEGEKEKEAREAEWKIHKAGMTESRTRHQLIPFDKLDKQEIGKDNHQVTIMLKCCSGYYYKKFSAEKLCIVNLEESFSKQG